MTDPAAERTRLEQTLLALEHAAASRLKHARGQSLVTGPDTEAIRYHLRTGYDFAEAIPTATLVSDVLAHIRSSTPMAVSDHAARLSTRVAAKVFIVYLRFLC